MATWYDLPQEVKQTILEQVVEGTIIKFTPRHAATRSTRAKARTTTSQEKHTSNGTINSMLLVSKRFVTYSELEPVLLSSAAIHIDDTRTVSKLAKRFTKDVFSTIQALVFVIERPGYANARKLITPLQSGQFFHANMTSLRKVTLKLPSSTTMYCFTLKEIIQLARGASLTQQKPMSRGNRTEEGRYVLRHLLMDVVNHHWPYSDLLQDFLTVDMANDRCEKVLAWTTSINEFGISGSFESSQQVGQFLFCR